MKLVITKHAIERFTQRFRLMFKANWFKDDNTRHLIKNLFNKSYRDLAFEMTPFYRNKLSVKHGRPLTLFKTGEIVFVCCVNGDMCFMLTCLRRNEL